MSGKETAAANESKKPSPGEKDVILRVSHISKRFTSKGVCVRAVTDVSFDVKKGETIGIVGESGCGKTTLGRCVVRAIEASEGDVLYTARDGRTYDFLRLNKADMKRCARISR